MNESAEHQMTLSRAEPPDAAYLGSPTGAFFLSSLGVIILALMLPLKIPSTTFEGKT